MKLNYSRKIHYEAGPNLTALVDVVMVILIFLMLAGSFGAVEHYLGGPAMMGSETSSSPMPDAPRDQPLEIRVDAPSPGQWTARVGSFQASDAAILTAHLRSMRHEFADAGITPQGIQVRLSPGRDVAYQDILRVYESAQDAGFVKIAFTASH